MDNVEEGLPPTAAISKGVELGWDSGDRELRGHTLWENYSDILEFGAANLKNYENIQQKRGNI